jgi:hypothetical protein
MFMGNPKFIYFPTKPSLLLGGDWNLGILNHFPESVLNSEWNVITPTDSFFQRGSNHHQQDWTHQELRNSPHSLAGRCSGIHRCSQAGTMFRIKKKLGREKW